MTTIDPRPATPAPERPTCAKCLTKYDPTPDERRRHRMVRGHTPTPAATKDGAE